MKEFLINLTTKKVVWTIIIFGLILFSKSLFNSYALDDGTQIISNTSIRSLSNLPSFFTGSTFYNGTSQSLNGVYYKPLLISFYSLIYSVFGTNLFVFHLLQIVLVLTNTILLFLILKGFFKKPLAFFLSLIFLVHPLNSEVAFYISATQEVLFFIFGILSFWILQNLKTNKQLIYILLFFWLALLSKETAILFVVIAPLYTYLFNKENFGKVFGISLFTTIGYLLLRLATVGFSNNPRTSPIDILSLPQRLLNVPSLFLFYIKTFFYPLDLASSHDWAITRINFDNFWLPLFIDLFFILLIFLGGFLVFKKSKNNFKIYLLFAVWFFIGMGLHMQIIPLDVTVAERWFYYPMVGILGIIGILYEAFTNSKVLRIIKDRRRSLISQRITLAFSILIILLFSTRTFIRSFDWSTPLNLYTHDVKVSDDYVLENALGGELFADGRLEEAKIHLQKSINLYPFHNNYLLLGAVYLGEGDYQKSKKALLSSLKYGDYYLTYEELGGLTLVSGTPPENISFLTTAVEKFPQDPKLWLYLAVSEYQEGKINEAKTAVTRSYLLDPNSETAGIYNTIQNNQPLKINPVIPKN